MIKYIVAYLGAGLSFAAIDAVWLTTMADRLYKPVLGPILAEKPDMQGRYPQCFFQRKYFHPDDFSNQGIGDKNARQDNKEPGRFIFDDSMDH